VGRDLHYRPGSFYRTDDRTGFPTRAERTKKEWTGLIVDEARWEPRQPQDLVRGVQDKQSVPEPRPLAPNQFIGPVFVQTSEAAAARATMLELEDTSPFYAGVKISIMMDNGVNFFTTVSGAPSSTAITLASPLPYSAAAGNIVTRDTMNVPASQEP
jgi:hypothetical protein